MAPLYQCATCQTKFLDPEVDLEDNQLYCPGCGVGWSQVREIPEAIEAKMFYGIIERSWTRAQRNELLRQFDA